MGKLKALADASVAQLELLGAAVQEKVQEIAQANEQIEERDARMEALQGQLTSTVGQRDAQIQALESSQAPQPTHF